MRTTILHNPQNKEIFRQVYPSLKSSLHLMNISQLHFPQVQPAVTHIQPFQGCEIR
jgi:hypothetical protein